MNREVDEVFEDQKIYLDYTIWERCHFLNCEIIVEYGMYHLRDCSFSSCELRLIGRAMNVARTMYIFFPDKIPLIFPEGVEKPLREEKDEVKEQR